MIQISTGPHIHLGAGFLMVMAFAISGVIWFALWWCMESKSEKREAKRTRAKNEDRFPDDALLRSMGWRVLSRPHRGQAIWIYATGITMTFEQALAAVHEHERTRPIEFEE